MSPQFWIILCSGISHGFQLNTTWNSHSALLCKKCSQDYRNIRMQLAWLINSYLACLFLFLCMTMFLQLGVYLVGVRNDVIYKQHTSPLFLRPFWLLISTVKVFQREYCNNLYHQLKSKSKYRDQRTLVSAVTLRRRLFFCRL